MQIFLDDLTTILNVNNTESIIALSVFIIAVISVIFAIKKL